MILPRALSSLLVAIVVFLIADCAQAKVVTRAIPYKHGDVELEGYLAYDDAVQGKAPGVLVVHEWWGLNDYAKKRARDLAEMGYVAFALDMYGKGVLAKDRDEAMKMSARFKGQPIIRTRAQAGLDVLAKQSQVDAKRIAAIGFCFGGTTCLELAYSGADLTGVVTFHGGLLPPGEKDEKISAKILALHGADDPHVPPEQVESFTKGATAKGLDWQLISYSDAVHTFTNPAAGNDKSTGTAYNQRAAERSWQHMQMFFKEIFALPKAAKPAA